MIPSAGITRVAMYLRARRMELAAEQSAALLAFVGSLPHWRIVSVFCDINSGTARPARSGAVAAAQGGGFDLLLVAGLDRLTRSTDELHGLIGQLAAAKVVLCTLDRWPASQPHGGWPQLLAITSSHPGAVAHRLREATASRSAFPALASRPARAEEEK